MVWSVAGLSCFSPQSMQNETAIQTAESAMQSSNCIAMTATHFLKQKLVPVLQYGILFHDRCSQTSSLPLFNSLKALDPVLCPQSSFIVIPCS